VIRWTTPDPGEAALVLHAPTGTQRRIPATSTYFAPNAQGLVKSYYRHEAIITGLLPGNDYGYQVLINGAPLLDSREFSFRTPGSVAFNFLVIGDTGTLSPEQIELSRRMAGERAAFVIHTGDLVYPTGRYEDYESKYFAVYQAMMAKVPTYPCPGNHDYYETGAGPYRVVHSLPVDSVPAGHEGNFYSFDWGPAEVFSLDSNDALQQVDEGRNPMADWFAARLNASRKFWRVAFFHHPPYAKGPNADDPLSALTRKHLTPILDRYRVPVVFSGHEHSYQRTKPVRGGQPAANGTVYFTSGGGGAHLYPVYETPLLAQGAEEFHYLRCEVDGWRMTVRAISRSGAELDRSVIAPPPIVEPGGVVEAASYNTRIGAGSLIALFGWQLSLETVTPKNAITASSLGNVTVSHSGRDLPLLMASPTQVNVALPLELEGNVRLTVETPNGKSTTEFEVVPVAPALFPELMQRRDGSLVTAELPAKAGEPLALFATGIGRLMAGSMDDIEVRCGSVEVDATAEPVPNYPGLFKILFTMPQIVDSPELQLYAGGASSNVILLPGRA
jgi:acid phosphatase type 7